MCATSRLFRRQRGMLAFVMAALSVPINPFVVLAQASDQRAEAHFTYDKGAPLDLKLVSVKILGTVAVQDITYSGRDGETFLLAW